MGLSVRLRRWEHPSSRSRQQLVDVARSPSPRTRGLPSVPAEQEAGADDNQHDGRDQPSRLPCWVEQPRRLVHGRVEVDATRIATATQDRHHDAYNGQQVGDEADAADHRLIMTAISSHPELPDQAAGGEALRPAHQVAMYKASHVATAPMSTNA